MATKPELRKVAGKVKELFEVIAAFQILMIFIQFPSEAKKVGFYLGNYRASRTVHISFTGSCRSYAVNVKIGLLHIRSL